jgi:hypothetical protein
MVCFDITLAVPLYQSYKRNVVQMQRIEHLRKANNADVLGCVKENDIEYIRFAACDEDAVGLLRDAPHPVYCVQVKLLRTENLLYSFYKATLKKVIPPRDNKVLKDIYWSASQLERNYVFILASRNVAYVS